MPIVIFHYRQQVGIKSNKLVSKATSWYQKYRHRIKGGGGGGGGGVMTATNMCSNFGGFR